MMTIPAYAAPIPKLRFTDGNGDALVGGKLFTYAAGTTTKATTYVDATMGTPNANPIILDSRGECTCFMPPGTFFKLTLSPAEDSDPPTNPIWTVDNLGTAINGVPYAVDAGSSNAIVATVYGIPSVPSVGASCNIKIADVNLAGPTTANINGWGAIGVKDYAGSNPPAAALRANQIAMFTYDGTYWRTQYNSPV